MSTTPPPASSSTPTQEVITLLEEQNEHLRLLLKHARIFTWAIVGFFVLTPVLVFLIAFVQKSF